MESRQGEWTELGSQEKARLTLGIPSKDEHGQPITYDLIEFQNQLGVLNNIGVFKTPSGTEFLKIVPDSMELHSLDVHHQIQYVGPVRYRVEKLSESLQARCKGLYKQLRAKMP